MHTHTHTHTHTHVGCTRLPASAVADKQRQHKHLTHAHLTHAHVQHVHSHAFTRIQTRVATLATQTLGSHSLSPLAPPRAHAGEPIELRFHLCQGSKEGSWRLHLWLLPGAPVLSLVCVFILLCAHWRLITWRTSAYAHAPKPLAHLMLFHLMRFLAWLSGMAAGCRD